MEALPLAMVARDHILADTDMAHGRVLVVAVRVAFVVLSACMNWALVRFSSAEQNRGQSTPGTFP